ncbi:MAG: di-trans,poly-cis-decaprenylcistransferase [Rickettsiales bacterium]|nr:di-trans,poly-cis-decaprenylcistransferase [Rickettsiales bacterium]|tara:strand:- start:1507 stop:2247 length:741 start_codon:yes stop_codon:yes gene_type:complete
MVSVPATMGNGPVPNHIAIIMDGNGRWANARSLPRAEGHRKGAEAVRRVVETASKLGISYLTLFGFSSENWKRPEYEIEELMLLLRLYLRSEIAEMHRNNIRFRMIGDRTTLPSNVVELIEHAEIATSGNSGLNLILALSYGGRQEIVNAARELSKKVVAGELSADEIDEDRFESHLLTLNIPDPDLLIRTSGEKRISNFLLWQNAYSELVFLDVLWPDFGEVELRNAITEFQSRERRFGTTASSS